MHMLVDLMIHNSWSDIDSILVKSTKKIRPRFVKIEKYPPSFGERKIDLKNGLAEGKKAIFNTKLSIRFGTNQPLAELVPNHAC